MTVLFWVMTTVLMTLISGLSEYRRWQWAAGVMETLEKP